MNSLFQNWKKFATYSANSLRNLTNKLLHSNSSNSQDQLSDSEVSRKKPATAASMSQGSTPSKLYNANLSGSATMKHTRAQQHMLPEATAMASQFSEEPGAIRNASLSNYILIKNSQSSLMGGQSGAQTIHKQISTGSLLLPTNLVHQHANISGKLDSIEAKLNELKLNGLGANKNICQEQTALVANEIK